MFACFSAAALLSPRRSYLFLGGMLASVMTTFFWMRFASWMFGGSGGALLYQVGRSRAQLRSGAVSSCDVVQHTAHVACQGSVAAMLLPPAPATDTAAAPPAPAAPPLLLPPAPPAGAPVLKGGTTNAVVSIARLLAAVDGAAPPPPPRRRVMCEVGVNGGHSSLLWYVPPSPLALHCDTVCTTRAPAPPQAARRARRGRRRV